MSSPTLLTVEGSCRSWKGRGMGVAGGWKAGMSEKGWESRWAFLVGMWATDLDGVDLRDW